MTLSVRKLFIDSRFAVSGDSSSFQYELPEVLELPHDTVAFVTEFTGVASWDTVNANNNSIYVVENTGALYSARVATIAQGAYDSETLRVAVETALNGASKTVAGTYTVVRSSSAGTVNTASLGSAYRYYNVRLDGGGSCFFPQDGWLQKSVAIWTDYAGLSYDPMNLRSSNELFQFPAQIVSANHTSSFIDLRSVHTLFVHSPSFGNYSTLAPRGVRTAIQKVPCEVGYGAVINFEHSGSAYDYIDVGSTTLKMLKFELKDARGNLVNLKGGDWSMTLVLAKK
jgi:hypothetical protein